MCICILTDNVNPDGVREAPGSRASVHARVLDFRVVYREPILPVPLEGRDSPACETER